MFASRDMPVLLPSKCTENFPLRVLFNSVGGKTMKKLLLIAVVAGGLTFAAAPRSDAQVFFSIGFGPGYYVLPLWVLLSVPLLLPSPPSSLLSILI